MSEDLATAHRAFRDRLVEHGLFIPTGADGLYGRSAEFEQVISGITEAVRRVAHDDAPVRLEFPPLITRTLFDQIGYLRNFPQLSGAVFSFSGNDRDHIDLIRRLDEGAPYADSLTQAEIALCPACCYPVYPTLRGTLAPGGGLYDVSQYCFRHEPSVDPMRLQSFRMIENIRVGAPDEVVEWRTRWLERAPQILADLGLEVSSDVANDPFFGRAGRLMSISQREMQLKIEFLVPVFGEDDPTACASSNYHQNHFGELFEIATADGGEAHSSCIGFGLERCAVAMFAAHGLDTGSWPAGIRNNLWP